MNNIDQNINKYNYQNQTGFKAAPAMPFLPGMNYNYSEPQIPEVKPDVYESEAPVVELPDIYYTPNNGNKTTFKEVLKKADMFNIIVPWLEHPLLMLGSACGLAWGVDKFTSACGGEYEKSIVGRAARLGDKIEESVVIQNKPVQAVGRGIKSGFGGIKKFLSKGQLFRAMAQTPTKPEWSIVKDELLHQDQRIERDFVRMMNDLGIGLDEAAYAAKGETVPVAQLSKLGLEKEEETLLKEIYGKNIYKLSPEKAAEAANRIQLKRLGFEETKITEILGKPNASQLVKNEVANTLGITGEKIRLMAKDEKGAYIRDAIEATKKGRGKIWTCDGQYNALGKFRNLFKRKIGCEEMYNRYASMTIGEGVRTKTGRFMSKMLQKLHRGFTFGGGKLGVLVFISPIIVDTILDTHKADKKEKVGTAAHGLIEAVSWVFTFPLALKAVEALGGMRFAGMTPEQVAKRREIADHLKSKVRAGEYEGKGGWKRFRKHKKIAMRRISKLEKVPNQNLITKIGRKLGKFLTMDLETVTGHNIVTKIPNFLRNVGGIPVRVLVWAGIAMGVLGSLINKGTKLIFGRYYDRFKEEENVEAKKKQEEFTKEDLQNRMYDMQAKKMGINPQTAQAEVEKSVELQRQPQTLVKKQPEIQQKENIVAETKNEPQEKQEEVKPKMVAPVVTQPQIQEVPQVQQTTKQKKLDNYSYIPSQENILKQPIQAQINKYIPAQTPGNIIKTFDNSGLEAALRRADRAEQRGLQILSGRFPS